MSIASPSQPAGGQLRRSYLIIAAVITALGGLLFGFDTGVISGALLYIKKDFNLTPLMQGVIVSAVLGGAFFGALAGGFLTDRLGRRTSLFCTSLLFAAGALFTAFVNTPELLIVGRVIVGLAIGLSSFVVPLYISEISPPQYRGALVTANQLLITIGILVSYGVNYVFAYDGGWRWMFAIAAIPALLMFAGLFLLPESPRFLLARGDDAGARAAVARSTTSDTLTDSMMADLRRELQAETGEASWAALLRPGVRTALIIGVGLAIFQQVTGINTVIYYAPTIFQQAGLQSAGAAILATAGIGVVNVLFTVVSQFLLDRAGRRTLLLVGIAGMVLGLAALGLSFFQKSAGLPAALSLALYIAAFAIGLGPVFWLLISEIYPQEVRGRAMSVATMANWGSNLIVALTFPLLIQAAGPSPTFFIYAAVTVLAFVFVLRLVPETKGKTFDQIQADLK
ncbi:sugar porter family MFS transporter [Deinococcus aquiradiocola]|uniref:MFS transporter n=1 Tax=Deinococcus aquiradiocola TaxID=393059 RepID=A0A917USN4_9DEIO|nr:sugar porter family MFS transporter [Deinococcus aquiradiocola]GGJ82426.1 MFS transporter [Deinococcus aquiradiocola]